MESLVIADLKVYKKIAQALSIDARIQIFELLLNEKLNINQISDRLGMPIPTVTVNVQKLEETDLIIAELKPGIRGSQKICTAKYKNIILSLSDTKEEDVNEDHILSIPMPIGHFVTCEIHPPCGMVSDQEKIGHYDDEKTFYLPEKVNAGLVWLSKGYLEYHFPNNIPPGTTIKSLNFSAELCSEVPYFKNHCLSDITLWINDIEIGTWTSPGDFGGKRGKLTPKWWGVHKTQYGLLTNWAVTNEGSFVSENKVSKTKPMDLNLTEKPFISVKIGIKNDAKHIKGMNLFGIKFGNYDQDLILSIIYNEDKDANKKLTHVFSQLEEKRTFDQGITIE